MRPSPAGLLLAAALGGCAGSPATVAPPPPLAFIVVRHAEKVDASRDPALSPAGQARARHLAQRLAALPLAAAYATQYQRTRLTAQPSAEAHGVPVATYDAGEPAGQLARRLRQAHPRGNVLIVGHSNTVPAIAAALCGCTVAPMDDAEYDRFLLIRIDADGKATLDTQRYGQPAAAAGLPAGTPR